METVSPSGRCGRTSAFGHAGAPPSPTRCRRSGRLVLSYAAAAASETARPIGGAANRVAEALQRPAAEVSVHVLMGTQSEDAVPHTHVVSSKGLLLQPVGFEVPGQEQVGPHDVQEGVGGVGAGEGVASSLLHVLMGTQSDDAVPHTHVFLSKGLLLQPVGFDVPGQ